MNFKNIAKKWGKIAMCGVTLLGATGGMLAANNITNNVMVAKAASSITTYTLVDSSGKAIGDKGLTTEGNLYYAKFTVSEYDSNYCVNYQVSEKTTITQGQSFELNVTNENFTGDNPGHFWYIYSTSSQFFEFADYFASVKWDTGGSPLYGSGNFYDWLNGTQYSSLANQMMMVGRPYNTSYSLSAAVVNLDDKAPALETQVFLSNVDNPISLEYILSQVKFVDEVDGNMTVTASDVTSDNYSSNKNKVGKWQIVVSKTDKAGNTGTGTIEVWVQDKTGPIITGQSTFTSNMSSPLTEAYIRSQLTATDNVDGNVEIQLVKDNFTGNEHVVGSKTIIYRATDAEGNVSADYTITVTCVDNIKPTITGESNYTTGYKNVINESIIKGALTLDDNLTSNLTLEEISNNYRGNESIPGTYQIKYRTTDAVGNISEVFTVTITVTDEIPPVFYVSGKFIGISQANTLTHQELVNLLIYMEGLIEEEGAAVNLLSFGGYETEAVNAPGVYTLSYRTRTADGVESEVKTATIKVLGEVDEEENPTDVEEEKEQWYKTAWNWVKEHATYFYIGLGIVFVAIIGALSFGKKDKKYKGRRRR